MGTVRKHRFLSAFGFATLIATAWAPGGHRTRRVRFRSWHEDGSVSDQPNARRRSGTRDGARPTSEGDTVTTFELFFDLVYVFAATRVTGYMVHAHDATGVVQGLLILALLWSTWAGYAWLGNQARADTGIVRSAMAIAMAGMFVVALAIPEAWEDAEGGLNGPLVLVIAYVFVRCVHLTAYMLVARGDAALGRQVAITWGPMLTGAVLLVAGALAEGQVQTAFFARGVVVDWGGLYLTTRADRWRLHSVSHFTERHGLFVLLAIGESLFAIGVGAAGQPISPPLLVAAVLGVAAALCLWWLYFDVVSGDGGTSAAGRARRRRASGWRSRPTRTGTSRSSPASLSAPSASRACSRTLVTASRWAASRPRHCTAGSRSTSPGTCSSSNACTARSACRGSSRPASCCSSSQRRLSCRHSSDWRGWCSSWVSSSSSRRASRLPSTG